MPRRFGVEVEFATSGSETIPNLIRELQAAGLSSQTRLHGYNGFSQNEWVVKLDGSIHDGGELVSPPLEFDNAEHRAQVYTAMGCLQRAGGKTDPRAGVHIHIDASDLSHRQIAYVARTTTKFEDAIYRIASSGWQKIRPSAYTYAKPLTDDQVTKLARCKDEGQLKRAWYGIAGSRDEGVTYRHGHVSRYYALNLHSWFFRGTVEFRFFNSTLNPKRLSGYIVLCNGIVQDARDDSRRTVNKAVRLGDMKHGVIPEKRARHRLMQMLRWEATTPCSKEDLELVAYCWKNSVPQDNFMLSAPAMQERVAARAQARAIRSVAPAERSLPSVWDDSADDIAGMAVGASQFDLVVTFEDDEEDEEYED